MAPHGGAGSYLKGPGPSRKRAKKTGGGARTAGKVGRSPHPGLPPSQVQPLLAVFRYDEDADCLELGRVSIRPPAALSRTFSGPMREGRNCELRAPLSFTASCDPSRRYSTTHTVLIPASSWDASRRATHASPTHHVSATHLSATRSRRLIMFRRLIMSLQLNASLQLKPSLQLNASLQLIVSLIGDSSSLCSAAHRRLRKQSWLCCTSCTPKSFSRTPEKSHAKHLSYYQQAQKHYISM